MKTLLFIAREAHKKPKTGVLVNIMGSLQVLYLRSNQILPRIFIIGAQHRYITT